ncbi:MAG: hypothetical protein QOE57_536, partial [Acidimicrobiaceae bacterium]|nr:hypothetical protein [Acidimicrobiaceae bacterium]
ASARILALVKSCTGPLSTTDPYGPSQRTRSDWSSSKSDGISNVPRPVGVTDPTLMWRRIVGSVRSYADLEPALVGAIERLIDFVTEPGENQS